MNTRGRMGKYVHLTIVLPLLVFFGCSSHSPYLTPQEQVETYPVEDSADVAPGLTFRYYEGKFQHVNDLPQGKALIESGQAGKPILQLNNLYTNRSNLFKSGKSRLIGFWFKGLLHLDRPGQYSFQALANDGIRIYLHGDMLFEDPEKHSARLTPVGVFEAEKGGWYPVQIFYFQRKGSAALKLYWKKPDRSSFEVVPSFVLGHMVTD